MKVLASYWLVCVVLWQYYSGNHAYYHKGAHPSKGQRHHSSGLQHDAGGTTDNPFLREPSSVISTRKPDLHHRQHPHERDENPKGYPQKRHYEQWLKHGAVGYKQSPSLSQSIPKVQAQKANIGDASSLALNRDDLSDPYQHQYMMDGSASSGATTPPTSSVGINQDESLIALTNNGHNPEQQQSASTLPPQLQQDNINQTQQHHNAELLHHNKGKKTTHSGKPHSRPVAGVWGEPSIKPIETQASSGKTGELEDSANFEPGGVSFPSKSSKDQVSFDSVSHETHRAQLELTDDHDRVRQYLFEQLVKGSRGHKRHGKQSRKQAGHAHDDADLGLMLQQEPASVASSSDAAEAIDAHFNAPVIENANDNEPSKSASTESQSFHAFRSAVDLGAPSLSSLVDSPDTPPVTNIVALTPTPAHKTEHHKSRRHKVSTGGNKRVPRAKPGRHVCTHEERVTKPVRVVESYCKPAYKSFTQRCANGTTCTAFRVQYDTIYRTVIKYQTSTEKRQTCCPGWTTSAKHAHGCLQPLCAQGCKHGGTCIKPDLCQCPLGYTGPTCETDVDECAGDHKCQQVCINTFGSYKCNCHDGFELQKDGRTCKFRIESVPELMAILEKLENLEKKQQEALAVAPTLPSVSTPPSPPVIEFNSTWIEEKLNRLEAQLNELSDRMDKLESDKTTASSSNNVDSAFSIASLSDQLGVLEERLAECKCGPN